MIEGLCALGGDVWQLGGRSIRLVVLQAALGCVVLVVDGWLRHGSGVPKGQKNDMSVALMLIYDDLVCWRTNGVPRQVASVQRVVLCWMFCIIYICGLLLVRHCSLRTTLRHVQPDASQRPAMRAGM